MDVKESRRESLKKLGFGAIAALSLPDKWPLTPNVLKTTHLVTLSFDDGLKKSSLATAEIFEKHKLAACINVIATAHQADFRVPNEFHRWTVGDFGLWNELKARGHEIMMHGLSHSNKSQMPFEEAKDSILRCIDLFSHKLTGFDPKKSIFNFPYNASSPALEKWLPTQVRAFRTGGPFINPMPSKGQVRLTSSAFGPENIDKQVEAEINKFLASPSGWFVCTMHGLDDEGWGPLSSSYLDGLLGRLTEMKNVQVGPPLHMLP